MNDKPEKTLAEFQKDEALKHRVSTRQQARTALAEIGTKWVSEAPVAYQADPAVPLLVAELQIRALLELGWTPPAYKTAEEREQPHSRVPDHDGDPVCVCGWRPNANSLWSALEALTAHIKAATA
jgi:hypothetical protein